MTNNQLAVQEQEQKVFSTPSSFEHAQRVAKMLSSSSLIPKEYQGNIQNTMIALEMANRIDASPLMVMQNLNVIQGKPSWSSTFIIGTLNSCGRFTPLRFEKSGQGDDYGYTAWAEDIDGNRIEGPKVDWNMVKQEGWFAKPGSKWKTMPELMFRYRSAAFFGRLYAPDLLMGMHASDEILDMRIQPAEEIAVEDIQYLFDLKKEILTDEEKKSAERIINNQEKTSYSKLYKILQSKWHNLSAGEISLPQK